MANSVTVTNFPNGLSTGDLTVTGTATFEGPVNITGATLSIRNLILTPTTAGNVISCDPASFTVGDVFCSIGNSGASGGVGTANGYETFAYNGTISTGIGIIANADATDFHGITAGAVGLFAENTDFNLSYNSDNGSFDIALTLTSADGNIEIFNELTVDGLTTINNQLNISPTSGGNISGLNVSTNINGQNLFAFVSNAYGTGSTGQTCGYITASFNGGQTGLISNGAATAYNGISANSIGIYVTDKDFSITSNTATGDTYNAVLTIDNATNAVAIANDANIGGDLSAATLSLTPTATGNVINSNANSDAVGDVFCYIGNTGGTGSAGHSCGYKTGAYNGGEIGLISNGDDVTYNGLAINSVGIYCTDKDFYITGNEGSGSTYSTFLAIDNSATGGVSILGTSDGSFAAAGFVGEVISSYINSASAVSLTAGNYVDITSITLTAGRWQLSGIIIFQTGGGSAPYSVFAGINSVAGNDSTGLLEGYNQSGLANDSTTFGDIGITIPTFYVTISVTTTYYLKANINVLNGTSGYGTINAARYS